MFSISLSHSLSHYFHFIWPISSFLHDFQFKTNRKNTSKIAECRMLAIFTECVWANMWDSCELFIWKIICFCKLMKSISISVAVRENSCMIFWKFTKYVNIELNICEFFVHKLRVFEFNLPFVQIFSSQHRW